MNDQDRIAILKKNTKYRTVSIVVQMIFAIICISMLWRQYDTMISIIAAFELTLCLSDFNKIKRNKQELKKLNEK